MSRKRIKIKREYPPDTKYNSKVIAKLINILMWGGKKSTAEKLIYGAMDIIEEKTKQEPLGYVLKAIDNIKPEMETKSRRVGGATYQVPVDVTPERQITLALRWLVQSSRSRGKHSMKIKLANELMDAHDNRGNAIKIKENTHKMAESNKAFAHFKW